MVRECYMFKKDGRCRFGDSCRYKHVKRNKIAAKNNDSTSKICPLFISKEGCKGGCKKAHAFKEDTELLEMFDNGIGIINIQLKEIDKLKLQMEMMLKLGEKDMYDLPTPSDSQSVASSQDTTFIQNNANPPSLTFSSFLGQSDNSRYKHESRAASEFTEDLNLSSQFKTLHNPEINVPKVYSDLHGDEYVREVQQMERLYRGRCQMLKNDYGTLFQIIMKPTDPDWNLTILEINLDVFVPLEYPSSNCSIEFCDERVSESTLESINTAIKEELAMREGTMCLRPMLRWIERNIKDMLQPETQFHTHSSLKVYKKGEIEWSDSDSDVSLEPEPSHRFIASVPDQTGEFLDKEVGTSVRLVDINLHGTSHGLVPQNVLFLLQCLRCKTQVELLVAPNSSKSLGCPRCSCELACNLYKKLCLPGTASIACVDLVGCSVADAILSRSQVSSICTECSASTALGLSPGTNNDTWCVSCGHKMTISFEGVKIIVINPPLASGKQKSKTKVDKGYTEGQPLPDRGTCKHYKKSERWFRFTCCGRLFPCDKCHDAQVPDCPLEQANRMVCGLCAKEQPVRNQCKFCHGEISGSLKSHHWEGGKGCRDKKRMSNNDSRKHKNSNLKTHSQKDKRVGQQKKKDGGD